MLRGSGQDIEWRLFNQLPKTLRDSYGHRMKDNPDDEWIARCRLIVDHISGLTDHSALELYQNAMGLSLSA
jgi:dGTP triphosphohydrolase